MPTPGLVFECSVTTPEGFVYGNDSGAWNWTQLVTPFEKRKRDGVWKEIGMSIPPPTRSIYGRLCLDNTYPYSDWYDANGVFDGSNDSPYDPLEEDPLVTAKDLLDSFECWFMYLPPGDGSVPVPLKKVVWNWEFHAVKSSGAWTVSGTMAQRTFDEDYPPHPEWDIVLKNEGMTYDY